MTELVDADVSWFGRTIKKLRRSKRMSQDKLAENSDTTKNTIHRIEKGEQVPRLDMAARMLQSLGVSVSEEAFERYLMQNTASDRELERLATMIRNVPENRKQRLYDAIELLIRGCYLEK